MNEAKSTRPALEPKAETTGTAKISEAERRIRAKKPVQPAGEQGGPKGPEPTRFGDWEKNGRAYDF